MGGTGAASGVRATGAGTECRTPATTAGVGVIGITLVSLGADGLGINVTGVVVDNENKEVAGLPFFYSKQMPREQENQVLLHSLLGLLLSSSPAPFSSSSSDLALAAPAKMLNLEKKLLIPI